MVVPNFAITSWRRRSGRAVIALVSLAFLAATAVWGKPDARDRAKIPDQYKWDLSRIYANWKDWQAGLARMESLMDEYAGLKGTLASGPQAVLNAYQLNDEIGVLSYKVYEYPHLLLDTDRRDNAVAARLQQADAAFAKFDTGSAWFEPELLAIPEATMRQWIAETPALKPYTFPIMDLYRQHHHVLDEEGERLLSYAQPFNGTPSTTYQQLSTADITFPDVTLSDGRHLTMSYPNYIATLSSARAQADRRAAFEGFYRTFAATINTYASIYNGVLQRDWFRARARNYSTTAAAALDEYDVPSSVLENLIDTVRAHTEPLRRYERLRRQLLNVSSYHLYDTMVPIVQDRKKYPYDEAKAMVVDSVKLFGGDYQKKMAGLLNGRRIDVYENEGKDAGAYSSGVYGVGPFMLLNYTDDLDSIFTLAHEAGHSMHTVLSYETQPFATSEYTIFVAEVASTTNERLLLRELMEKSHDPKERFALLQYQIGEIVDTFYTQVLFADFERQAHRLAEAGKPITAAVLNGIYGQLLHDYYGDSIDYDDLYDTSWAHIPHFFNSPYYVYQYATCFASSAKLFKDMTTGPEAGRHAAVERYLNLLKSGGSDYPMNELRQAGVDLSKPQAVQAVVDQLDSLVDQMQAEAKKF